MDTKEIYLTEEGYEDIKKAIGRIKISKAS